jgi:glucokinase
VNPFAIRGELLIRTPVQPSCLREPALLERHRKIEVSVRVGGVDAKRLAIALLCLHKATQIVEDVPQIEMRLEHVRFECDRAFVKRLGFGQFVSRVVDVREIDQSRHQVGIDGKRPAISVECLIEVIRIPVVQCGREGELPFGGDRLVSSQSAHECSEWRGFRSLELDDLRRLRIEPEIERQLPATRRQQISNDCAEAGAVAQLGICLPNDCQIPERIEHFAMGTMRGLDEPPLVHVAQVIVAQVRVSLEYLPTRDSAWTRSGHCATHYNPVMVLAGDVGGTKTLLGLFEPGTLRPISRATRSYETASFRSFVAMLDMFLADVQAPGRLHAAAVGVAGPVVHDHAKLTNVGWHIGAPEIRSHLDTPHVRLMNDLEAMARSIEVLTPEELLVLQEGTPNTEASIAVIAAGTGLGEAFLHRRNGRLVPAPSEGGHADFAARTDREIELVRMVRDRYGRTEIEQVISGPGLLNLHRLTHRGGECALVPDLDAPDAPAAVSKAGLGGRCQSCTEALGMFVSAYGAEAGNLALRGLALGGIYVGGGIAPKILPAIESGAFLKAFLDKEPMTDMLTKVPVKVILNSEAGLIGAASCASELGTINRTADS